MPRLPPADTGFVVPTGSPGVHGLLNDGRSITPASVLFRVGTCNHPAPPIFAGLSLGVRKQNVASPPVLHRLAPPHIGQGADFVTGIQSDFVLRFNV